MSRVLLATRNAKKLAELQRILGTRAQAVGLADVPKFEELPETGSTFEENAIAKAEQAATQTGEITLADDSGLSVDAMNGMPGVFSARWSGKHGDDAANTELLLAQMGDVPDGRRGAAFVCALALAVPKESLQVVRGEWRGRILRQPRGSNGFGYDPIFVPEETDDSGDRRSAAQLLPSEKDSLSHRGRALSLIMPELAVALGWRAP